jgi:hypothetical protein
MNSINNNNNYNSSSTSNNNSNKNATSAPTITTSVKEMSAGKEQRFFQEKKSVKQVNLRNESLNSLNPFASNNINWNSINLNYNFPMFNFASKSKVLPLFIYS